MKSNDKIPVKSESNANPDQTSSRTTSDKSDSKSFETKVSNLSINFSSLDEIETKNKDDANGNDNQSPKSPPAWMYNSTLVNEFKENELFRPTENDINANIMHIEDALKCISEVSNEKLDQLIDGKELDNIVNNIIRMHEVIMSIPYKYGRANLIAGLDHEQKAQSKFLTVIGLSNIVKELRMAKDKDNYSEMHRLSNIVIGEIDNIKKFIEHLMHFQLNENVFFPNNKPISFRQIITDRLADDKTKLASLSAELAIPGFANLTKRYRELEYAINYLEYELANLNNSHIDQQNKKIRFSFDKNQSEIDRLSKINEELKKDIQKAEKNERKAYENAADKKDFKPRAVNNAIQNQINYEDTVLKHEKKIDELKAENMLIKKIENTMLDKFKENDKSNIETILIKYKKELESMEKLYNKGSIKFSNFKLKDSLQAIKDKIKSIQREISDKNEELSLVKENIRNLESECPENKETAKSIETFKAQSAIFNNKKIITNIENEIKECEKQLKETEILFDKRLWYFLNDVKNPDGSYTSRSEVMMRQIETSEKLLACVSNVDNIKFSLLEEYQNNYDCRNIENILDTTKNELFVSNTSITKMISIVNFISWQSEHCGKRMKAHIEAIISMNSNSSGSILKDCFNELRNFRNRGVMHCLDDIDALAKFNQAVTDGSIERAKNQVLEIIDVLRKNLTSLQNPDATVPDQKSDNPKKGKNDFSLTNEKQVERFGSAISNSISIIDMISKQIDLDSKQGNDLNKIYEIMKKDSLEFNTDKKNDLRLKLKNIDDLRLKLKYDALIQALGQAIGNLQQYEELPTISKLNIKAEGRFPNLVSLIPIAKDYRSSRTHDRHYDHNAFKQIITTLFSSKNSVINELKALFICVDKELQANGSGLSLSDKPINHGYRAS